MAKALLLRLLVIYAAVSNHVHMATREGRVFFMHSHATSPLFYAHTEQIYTAGYRTDVKQYDRVVDVRFSNGMWYTVGSENFCEVVNFGISSDTKS